jgi:hypothetical protein
MAAEFEKMAAGHFLAVFLQRKEQNILVDWPDSVLIAQLSGENTAPCFW